MPAALNVACQVAVAVPALQDVPVPVQLPLALKLMMANVGSKPPGPSSTAACGDELYAVGNQDRQCLMARSE